MIFFIYQFLKNEKKMLLSFKDIALAFGKNQCKNLQFSLKKKKTFAQKEWRPQKGAYYCASLAFKSDIS